MIVKIRISTVIPKKRIFVGKNSCMQKTVYMNSMVEINEDAITVALLAKSISEELKKESEDILREIKSVFELSNKSIRAFFMANEKEKFELTKFNDILDSRKQLSQAINPEQDQATKNNIKTRATKMLEKISKHLEVAFVVHDNGKRWKKTQVDKDRFFAIAKNLEDIIALVS